MKWWTAAIVLFSISAEGSDLDPICHEYYEMIQSPGLTYENVGRIAEAMYHKQCWPALQGTPPPAQTADNSPIDCEYLAEQLVNGSTDIAKLFDVRPMVQADCGEPYRDRSREHSNSVIPVTDGSDYRTLDLSQCDLLITNPELVADRVSGFGLRPVNCRGKIVYSDGIKKGFYFYMEQYSDGDGSVWGLDIYSWRW